MIFIINKIINSSSLSVSVFAFNKIAAFDGDSSEKSFCLGIRIDCRRTSHGHITFEISAQWSGGYREVASERQVATFGKCVDSRFARQNYDKVGHLKPAGGTE